MCRATYAPKPAVNNFFEGQLCWAIPRRWAPVWRTSSWRACPSAAEWCRSTGCDAHAGRPADHI